MVELGLTPDSRWQVDTGDYLEAARAAGFSSVGLFSRRIDDQTVKTLAEAGMKCHEVLGLVVVDDESATIASARRLAREAALVGAPWVITTFHTDFTGDLPRVVERCAATFAEAGAGMAIEFSPLGPVAPIGDGLEAVAVASPTRAGLVIDSWNFCFGESTWDELARVPLERIAYLQFTDALEPISKDLTDEALNRRAMPGEGTLPLERFVETFRARRWEGVVSLQILSSELRQLPLRELAQRAHDSASRFWF